MILKDKNGLVLKDKSSNKILNVRVLRPPTDCILLDYFKDGYRFGVEPTGDAPTLYGVSDTDTYNLSYFDHGRFGDSFPSAKFDGTGSNSNYEYEILNYPTLQEFTIEMLLRFDVIAQNYRSAFRIYYGTDEGYHGYFRMDRTGWYGDSISYGRNDRLGTYKWTSGPSIYTNIDGAREWIGWHHVAITIKDQTVYLFIDGKLKATNDVIEPRPNNRNGRIKLQFHPFSYDTNQGSKAGYYQIAQLAVWNTAKYTAEFTPSRTLIIDSD